MCLFDTHCRFETVWFRISAVISTCCWTTKNKPKLSFSNHVVHYLVYFILSLISLIWTKCGLLISLGVNNCWIQHYWRCQLSNNNAFIEQLFDSFVRFFPFRENLKNIQILSYNWDFQFSFHDRKNMYKNEQMCLYACVTKKMRVCVCV